MIVGFMRMAGSRVRWRKEGEGRGWLYRRLRGGLESSLSERMLVLYRRGIYKTLSQGRLDDFSEGY